MPGYRERTWRVYALGKRRIGGSLFALWLLFDGQRLHSLDLELADTPYATAFDRLHSAHCAWLVKHVSGGAWTARSEGLKRAWGDLWASADYKTGEAMICVRYCRRRRRPAAKSTR